jgi:hypothetical protein
LWGSSMAKDYVSCECRRFYKCTATTSLLR